MAKQKKLSREQVLQLMKFYEQKYFTHDDPVPFKRHLKIYPAKVREYYDFYFNILCFKMNKTPIILSQKHKARKRSLIIFCY